MTLEDNVIISEPISLENGKISIPKDILDGLGIQEGGKMVAMGDRKRKEIVLYHLSDVEGKLVELQVTMKDTRGSLAELTQLLAKANVDIQTAVLPPSIEDQSVFSAVLNLTKLSISLGDLEGRIRDLDFVVDVEIESH
ncbi:MAG: hypothetical protein ACE5OZ_02175 [Candidatus Heimdallarchaeota archaeon]